MSITTLTPTDDDDSQRFAEIVADYDTPPRRRTRRTVVLPEREAINQGLRFRRHRSREREV